MAPDQSSYAAMLREYSGLSWQEKMKEADRKMASANLVEQEWNARL